MGYVHRGLTDKNPALVQLYCLWLGAEQTTSHYRPCKFTRGPFHKDVVRLSGTEFLYFITGILVARNTLWYWNESQNVTEMYYYNQIHYLNQCGIIVNWTLGDKRQWNFNPNTKFFIQEKAFENIVCEMVAILSRGRWVNWDLYMIVAADWTDGVCGCIYCSWNSTVKLYVKKRPGSILVQVMTCWLMTPSQYLDQCWLIMIEVKWYLY